jgi:hypothetical protein
MKYLPEGVWHPELDSCDIGEVMKGTLYTMEEVASTICRAVKVTVKPTDELSFTDRGVVILSILENLSRNADFARHLACLVPWLKFHKSLVPWKFYGNMARAGVTEELLVAINNDVCPLHDRLSVEDLEMKMFVIHHVVANVRDLNSFVNPAKFVDRWVSWRNEENSLLVIYKLSSHPRFAKIIADRADRLTILSVGAQRRLMGPIAAHLAPGHLSRIFDGLLDKVMGTVDPFIHSEVLSIGIDVVSVGEGDAHPDCLPPKWTRL